MVSRTRLAAQRLLACDVDGVLTEGGIIYGSGNQELKVFSIKDGLGIRVATCSHFPVVWLARRSADAVARRAAELNVQLYQGESDKEAVLRRVAEQYGLALAEITYVGDDLDDLRPMRIAGLAVAVADAAPEVQAAADVVTRAPGGKGAAREVIELLFHAQDRWDAALACYLDSLAAPTAAHLLRA
ncbi:MAG TPA: HAD hydrolase family protein [Armatimonadota bacterium]|nr:HAD hydrolase family protein [Armatimonadota bacterium]HOS44714.1 HAD hydrolase family protein [Armatimonadota bacterium]